MKKLLFVLGILAVSPVWGNGNADKQQMKKKALECREVAEDKCAKGVSNWSQCLNQQIKQCESALFSGKSNELILLGKITAMCRDRGKWHCKDSTDINCQSNSEKDCMSQMEPLAEKVNGGIADYDECVNRSGIILDLCGSSYMYRYQDIPANSEEFANKVLPQIDSCMQVMMTRTDCKALFPK